MKIVWLLIGVFLSSHLLTPLAQGAEIPRTTDGKPNLSGNYDITTATPVERRPEFGTQRALTATQVEQLNARMAAIHQQGNAPSDPNRGAPPVGGNIGGYNLFFIDIGHTPMVVNGEFRTSVITDPPDGRKPKMTDAASVRAAKYDRSVFKQDGAWWLDSDKPGPFDGPESLTIVDRCLVGRGVPAGPPILPTIYNNMKRIVQTPDHVMILAEMVHDARIIRLNSQHVDPAIRLWLGDSIGWWEDDTLVVDTTNFHHTPALEGASSDLHVVERFTRVDDKTLLYSFTVDDPNSWAQPFSGEYPWPQSEDRVYEYACHEGNYAMVSILKGARIAEQEAAAASDAAASDAGDE